MQATGTGGFRLQLFYVWMCLIVIRHVSGDKYKIPAVHQRVHTQRDVSGDKYKVPAVHQRVHTHTQNLLLFNFHFFFFFFFGGCFYDERLTHCTSLFTV